MGRGFLSERVKLTKVTDHTTAGTSAINSGSVDMTGYKGVIFFTSFGTAAVDNTIEAASSTDDSTFADIAGTNVVPGASDEDVWVDVWGPPNRYVRCEIARGTSSTCESIWAIQYDPVTSPQDNTTTGTIAGEAHAQPIAGTA